MLYRSKAYNGRVVPYDLKTEKALRLFQKSMGLKVTGQPDSQTLLHLYKTMPDLYRPKLK